MGKGAFDILIFKWDGKKRINCGEKIRGKLEATKGENKGE